jgi:amino acid adenylation domain-containing protein
VQALVSFGEARGSLEQRLVGALVEVARRHEILRTSFAPQQGIRVPLQLVHPELAPHVRVVDLAAQAVNDVAARMAELRRAELTAPLDLRSGSPMRALLARAGEQSWLIVTVSALCADPASMMTLLSDVCALCAGEPPAQAPLQYADYAEWRRQLVAAESSEADAARTYWRSCDGLRSPELPLTRGGAPGLVRDDAWVAPPANTEPTSDVVLAAWIATLARSSTEESVALAVLGSTPELASDAVGPLAELLPLHVATFPEMSLSQLHAEVEGAQNAIRAHQDHAPADVQRGLTAGFQRHVLLEARVDGVPARCERVTMTNPHTRLEFDPTWIGREAASALARRFELMLRAAIETPEMVISAVEVIDDDERRSLTVTRNPAATPVPPTTVDQLIARHAAAAPGHLAVTYRDESVTYAELDRRANQLAHLLRQSGVTRDAAVGLDASPSSDLVVGLLGIMRAGAAYVPLHPDAPPARLHAALSAVDARIVIARGDGGDALSGADIEVLRIDSAQTRERLEAAPQSPPDGRPDPKSLAYIVFTSGSTGAPKPVGITHESLVNYALALGGHLGADAQPMTFALVTSLATDLGNTSVYGSLCHGGTLEVVDSSATRDPRLLARRFDEVAVDVLKATPSHVRALLSERDARVLPRRWLVLGGERLSWDLVAAIRELSTVAIVNHYGPTETTVGACMLDVPAGPGPVETASVPIGRPLPNTRCYVLDEQRRPVPVGQRGRLFIAGAGVAPGYVGRPDLTAERFVDDPFVADAGQMYDTGDLVRWLPDAILEFLGRDDEQLKVRGYRVEPGEIETNLRSHPDVSDAVVIGRQGPTGDTTLAAYCAVTAAVSAEELETKLGEQLPAYMIPSAFVLLPELPRTAGGKIDRHALPDPPADQPVDEQGHIAPRDPYEREVALIWSELLGVGEISVDSDFFRLGGHSLLATQAIAQLRSRFDIELPLHALFLAPTVETLAAEIARLGGVA